MDRRKQSIMDIQDKRKICSLMTDGLKSMVPLQIQIGIYGVLRAVMMVWLRFSILVPI